MKSFFRRVCLGLVLALVTGLLPGCGARPTEVSRLIGVSLANLTDEWRIVLKNELEEEALKYPGIKLVFTDAGGNSDKQKQDMRELLEYGAELLIVSPVDVEELMGEIEEIYREETPILLLDRAVKGFDYTCFFGVDDKLLVRQEAALVTSLTEGSGDENVKVLNIIINNYTGRQRAGLFREAAPKNMEVTQAMIQSGTRDETEDIILHRVQLLTDVDIILTQNDYMAYGAHLALEKLGRTDIKIVGVDGFTGKGGGIDMVKEGLIDATIVCPTGGIQALSYAVRYLEGDREGAKQIITRNSVVTRENVSRFAEGADSSFAGEIKKVGYVQINENTGFRKANTDSFADAAKEYGIELEIRECLTIEEQLTAFREFLESGKDAIIVSPLVEDGWEEVFTEARLKGIPVILSDREVSCSEELYTAFVGSDFIEEGARCMRWIRDNLGGQGTVRILELEGTKGASPAIGRGNGFRSLLRESDGFEIVGSINGNFSRAEGYTAMKEYLEGYGQNFDVVFSHNDDMMIGAIDAMKEYGIVPGEDVATLSIDGTGQALKKVQEGEISFVAECTPLLGPNVMRTLSQLSGGEEVPIRVISSEETFDINTPDTVFRARKY
jgi:simple sugar transport system substrate-binding protein